MIRETEDIDLTGKMLIAMPGIGDDRFDNAIILICAHAEDFAMGLVLNKPMEGLTLPELLDQLNVPLTAHGPDGTVLDGGPVGRDQGFVLHSDDFNCEETTMRVTPNLCLTATRDILHAIASDAPPRHSVLALGYAGWGPGQIEMELSENVWLVCECDNDLVYAQDHTHKWEAALEQIGISPAFLQAEAGRA